MSVKDNNEVIGIIDGAEIPFDSANTVLTRLNPMVFSNMGYFQKQRNTKSAPSRDEQMVRGFDRT